MPRSLKKEEQPTPKKNEAPNKKRKRTEDDIDNKTSNKKIKKGWLRDMKAVLRSAGNRLVHIESDSKLSRASRKKSKKDKKNESEIIVNSEDGIDQGGMTLIENSDMPIMNNDERNSYIFNLRENLSGTITSLSEVEHLSIKPNTQNDLEESCAFQLIQCKASGTMIRLENVSSSDIHQTPNNIEEREDEQVNLPAQSSINIGILQDTNYILPAPAVTKKDSIKRCINGFKNNNYFFGTDNKVDNSQLNTGYTFASSHNNDDLMITETNEVDMDMTELDSQRSDDSVSNHNLTDCWINPRRGNCTAQNGYLINGSTEYQLPSTNNTITGDSVEVPQEKFKFPITQAYYDSSTGAYVDPLTLQDNKVQNSTNSFKNTWGSIKNLISRVSGNKGSGDVQDSQPEDIVTQTEEDLHS